MYIGCAGRGPENENYWPLPHLSNSQPTVYSATETYTNTLRPESSENIPILLQVADLCFPKQNVIRNPKMGSKQSVTVPTQ
jgi:hypothetical protein